MSMFPLRHKFDPADPFGMRKAARKATTPEVLARAEAERIDPALLVPLVYDDSYGYPGTTGPPCVSCGHPRWAHAVAHVYWDGMCLCGCLCTGGYAPGVFGT